MLLNAFEFKKIIELQNTYPETLLEDVNSWFERLLKMAKGVNSWLQDLDTLQEDGKTRNANSCSQDRQALLEDLVVAEWQLPDSTLRACWNITRDHRARLFWSNRDFFRILQIYLQYLLSYVLKFLICIHAGNPRVPPQGQLLTTVTDYTHPTGKKTLKLH